MCLWDTRWAEVKNAEAGEWSRSAVTLLSLGDPRRGGVGSPDGSKTIVVDGVRLRVVENGHLLPGLENTAIGTLAEISWAPDSKAFFVTESDGGTVGSWSVDVFTISDGGVVRTRPTEEVVRRFSRTYRCHDEELPNVGAVSWGKNSEAILVVAEVPPHSSCPEMGKVRGYIVSVADGKVIEEVSPASLRGHWRRHLGDRLKDSLSHYKYSLR